MIFVVIGLLARNNKCKKGKRKEKKRSEKSERRRMEWKGKV